MGRQTQAGTREGNQQTHTHRRVTSAQQRRATTAQNGNQLNPSTRATSGNPATRALHMHQTRTPRMHHSTAYVTKIAPKYKHGPDRGQSRTPPECTQNESRYAGGLPWPTTPWRPQARPNTTAPERKGAKRISGPRGECGGKRRKIEVARGHVLNAALCLKGLPNCKKLSMATPCAGIMTTCRPEAQ